jgi:hypothetical protein
LLQQNFIESGSNVVAVMYSNTWGVRRVLAAAEDRDFLIRAAGATGLLWSQNSNTLSCGRPFKVQQYQTTRAGAPGGHPEKSFCPGASFLQPLLGRSLSNTYTYLTMRALDSSTSRQRSLMAVHCLRKAIAHDRSLIVRKPPRPAMIAVKVALCRVVS